MAVNSNTLDLVSDTKYDAGVEKDMGYAGLAPAISRLVMSALGLGVLTLGAIFIENGIFTTVLISAFIVGSFMYTSLQMVFAYNKTNKKLSTGGDLYGQTIGNTMKILFEVSFFFFVLFAMTGMIWVITKTFYGLQRDYLATLIDFEQFKDIADKEERAEKEFKFFQRYSLPVVGIFIICLQIPKDVSFLSFAGIGGLIAFIYLALVIIIYGISV